MTGTTIGIAELREIAGGSLRRRLRPETIRELREGGILWPILERVQHDDTLDLQIRGDYVDIYYRGGLLLGLHPRAKATRFSTEFAEQYCDQEPYCPPRPPRPPKVIESAQDARSWVDVFAAHKQLMDLHFWRRPKIEREYQQAVVRDNNRHVTGGKTDYAVVDIEYVPQGSRSRFDMVGFRWPLSRSRRGRDVVKPVIMELKAGDGAVRAECGLCDHVDAVERILAHGPDEPASLPYLTMCLELVEMFEAKRQLRLPSIPERMAQVVVGEVSLRPEVLLVVANHQPAATGLNDELREVRTGTGADYLVATVQHVGYGLFFDAMKPLDKFVATLPPRRRPRATDGDGRQAAVS